MNQSNIGERKNKKKSNQSEIVWNSMGMAWGHTCAAKSDRRNDEHIRSIYVLRSKQTER